MSLWISIAFLNCLIPRSRCLRPTIATTPKWMCVRALIGCFSSPAADARSSACFRIFRASSYFFA